ncbi:MAG: glycosyltransferase family 4 protein [Rhodobacteraceae bacterium]|nr:glycosyltransferase family 4 protein [Paracoccaceae bacterium]
MAMNAQMSGRGRASSTTSIVLVVHVGAINPQSGGGQRTAILFEALKRLGEVAVLILVEQPLDNVSEFFPGAVKVVQASSRSMTTPPKNMLLRSLHAGLRLVFPETTFSTERTVAAALGDMLANWHGPGRPAETAMIVSRYFRSFTATGYLSDPENRAFAVVDIDDRDDHKMSLQIRRRGGNLIGSLAHVILIGRFQRLMLRKLGGTSLVLLAKDRDRFDRLMKPQVIVPNVPFNARGEPAPVEARSESLLFVGVPGHRPNLAGVTWFLRACWPAVRAARPAARFRIVGLGDWSALPADLAAQPGVEVVGGVDDLAPEYGQARAAICPILEGAGSQIKVIEACAYGRPVVSTAFASGGFGPEIERALSVASDPAGFAQACIDLLADPARAARQGATLRALQQATHSREAVENLIVTTLTDLVASVGPDRKVPS